MAPSVLVVEDDPGYRAALIKVIESYFPHVQVLYAENGPDALSITRLIQFNVVILDYYLQAMGGSDVARYLRQRPGLRTPIILTSSQPDVEIFTRALGAVAFLQKPCRADDLVAVLSPLLTRD
jgi:putative two-component system response regulator